MRKRFLYWFRLRILRSRFPAQSRSELEVSIDMLNSDLKLAMMHGLWRENHPLSATKRALLSRFPAKITITSGNTRELRDEEGLSEIIPANTDAPNIDCAEQLRTMQELRALADAAVEQLKAGAVRINDERFALPAGSILLGNFEIKSFSPKSLAKPTPICDAIHNEN